MDLTQTDAMTKTGAARPSTPNIEPETLAETWVLYQRQIIIGAIVVGLAGGSWWLWSSTAAKKEEKGGAAFAAAEASFMSGNQALAVTELEKIVTRYAGTTAGAQAAMLIAQAQMEQGKFTEAQATLQAALGKAPKRLRAGVLSLTAAAQEGLGKPADAAASYGRAAAEAQFPVDRDMHLMEQARTLVAAGDLAAAAKIYAEVAGREDSAFAGEAKVRLGEVSAKK